MSARRHPTRRRRLAIGPRLAGAALVATITVAVAFVTLSAGCGSTTAYDIGDDDLPTPATGAAQVPSTPPASSGLGSEPSAQPGAAPTGGPQSVLAAVAARRLFDLVDDGRHRQAQRLLWSAATWRRTEMKAIKSARVIATRVWGSPTADTVVLLARVQLRTRGATPWADGVNEVFLTLQRRASTGDWLISAIGTSP